MICEPTRTQIVRVLSSGPLSVGDLAAILGRSKSATSQHLRVLRDGGVVSARRRGRAVIYSLTSAPMVETTVLVLNRAASIAAA
jgi:DNA-binding transcriptional ArsR family regulator